MSETTTATRVAAAARRILTAEGAPAVTMRRVAAEAGVTTMATYRHFANREALLRRVVDDAFAEINEKWSQRDPTLGFECRLAALLSDFLDFALGAPHLYRFLLTDRRDDARRYPDDYLDRKGPAFGQVLDTMDQGIREGILRADDALEMTVAITTPVMGLLDLYLGGRMDLTETQFRTLCIRTVQRIRTGLDAAET